MARRDPWLFVGLVAFLGGNGGSGDLRLDPAAPVGYLAGRLALGAEELPR